MPFRPDRAVVIVGVLHVVGWGVLLILVMPMSSPTGGGAAAGTTVFGVGLGATAYALGLRHAFDADHIAIIDNTTRRLLAEHRPARTVGLWFSLGHATIVTALSLLIAFGVRSVGADLADEGSVLHQWTSAVGPAVSGAFLLVIAGHNTAALLRRRRSRNHHHRHAGGGGPVSMLLRRFGAVIDRPSRMYVVGLLFGLGFDTATEVGLLALAGAASVGTGPWWAILVLPVLFAAGMSLLDSAQGIMSRYAYSWRATEVGTADRYDLVVTGVSIMAALGIAVVELAGFVADWLPVTTGWLGLLGSADLGTVGFVLTGALLAAWAVAAALARLARARPAGRVAAVAELVPGADP